MRVCLMIEGQAGVTWEQWVALAEACGRGGIEGLFRSDHYSSVAGREDRSSLDAWATLAGLAAITPRIRLGTMVSPATFRHPSVLAKMAATVDHISHGRVELGMGAGWMDEEHRAYGFPFPPMSERLELLVEQLEIVHRQWTEDEFDFEGRHYRLERCRALPKPVQQPHPPLIVGGGGKQGTIEPAVRWADEYDTVFKTPDECRQIRRRVDEACERGGRDPSTLRFSLMTACVVGRDEHEVRERLSRLGVSAEWASGRLVGTVDDVVDHLREYEEAGVERVYLQHLAHEDVEMVDAIAEGVAPAVQPQSRHGVGR